MISVQGWSWGSIFLDATATALFALGVLAAKRIFGLLSLQSFVAVLFLVGFGIRALFLDLSLQRVVFRYLYVSRSVHDQLVIHACIAFFAIFVGYLVGWRYTAGASVRPANTYATKRYHTGLLIGLFVAVAVIQFALIRHAFDGAVTAIEALSRRSISSYSIGFAANLTLVAMPTILLALASARARQAKGLVAVCVLLLLVVLPWFVVLNGRAIVIVVIWSIGMLSVNALRRRRVSVGLWLGGGVAVALAAVVGFAWRYSSQSGMKFGAAVQSSLAEGPRIISDALPLFDHFRVGLSYVNQAGMDNGGSLLDAFTVLVPRSMWPEKPQFLPQLIGAHVLHYGSSGLPAGLLGEAYIGFGLFGIILYSTVFGVVVSVMQRLVVRLAEGTLAHVSVTYFAVLLLLTIVRTGPQGGLILAQICVLYAPGLMLANWMFRRKHGPDRGVEASSSEAGAITAVPASRK
jgi:hypothetical protein